MTDVVTAGNVCPIDISGRMKAVYGEEIVDVSTIRLSNRYSTHGTACP